jgi:6-phosphogluconolactonase (cycloisomerase 2 family)
MRVPALFFGCLVALFVVGSSPAGDGVPATNGQYLYVNNDFFEALNSVEAFAVSPAGRLAKVPGSPFSTGGKGLGGGSFANTRVVVAEHHHLLFASNSFSGDVSAFGIDPATGSLKLVHGSPFSTGGSGTEQGLGVAVSKDERFLFTGNSASFNVSAFTIGPTGALTPVPGSPFPAADSPNGIKVTPDGKFVIVALPVKASLGVYAVAANGALTEIPGSPFGAAGFPSGLDINCGGRFLFVGDGGDTTQVEVYSIGAKGRLDAIPGSPFRGRSGINSNVPLLSFDDKFLYVTNQASASVTVFKVDAASGALSEIAGSPFPDGRVRHSDVPSGEAADPHGRFLFTGMYDSPKIPDVGVLLPNKKSGALTQAKGSPFSLGGRKYRFPVSVATFPPKTCRCK